MCFIRTVSDDDASEIGTGIELRCRVEVEDDSKVGIVALSHLPGKTVDCHLMIIVLPLSSMLLDEVPGRLSRCFLHLLVKVGDIIAKSIDSCLIRSEIKGVDRFNRGESIDSILGLIIDGQDFRGRFSRVAVVLQNN